MSDESPKEIPGEEHALYFDPAVLSASYSGRFDPDVASWIDDPVSFEVSFTAKTPEAADKIARWMRGEVDDVDLTIGEDVECDLPETQGKKLQLRRRPPEPPDRLDEIERRLRDDYAGNPAEPDIAWLVEEVRELRDKIDQSDCWEDD